ncbi:MAG: sulfur oxidation c-type cytochrome SoxA [Gammaproteobacteria bacterium]|jgi:sulfur-oxidizing protein SoxA|nr:sulfur oxidation c-type cytochrome SoxA [Gammaproteobacteria bacterium]MDH3864738.1 sulfur oxidation c-type cytochrome SoxA [Gammaproteobacteria bacterium]MDH3906232.1 sulfur oxidation c-type cytochrome SoxA [Gammaproteobacteria bacterium]MDH3907819.1 sulfur oxidation c-type cytochrome SoxA [Gammaproteobacteria bacterium]MDH4003646.1 sulfur oxidation c-type cytochrome SoxA [Gammaproteobacteria bacterium]
MKNSAAMLLLSLVPMLTQQAAVAGPEDDREAFVEYFQSRFPDVAFAEFANGIYAIDEDARGQWLDIEEFPPYEFAVEQGETLWQEALPDGARLADCFGQSTGDIRPAYPRFDAGRGEVVTLAVAINDCRQTQKLPVWPYDSEELISITAYLAYAARGKPVVTQIHADEPGALAAYEEGKRFYYSKRGQLNFACSDCHVTSVGLHVRADRLSPSLGHTTHFPVYRSKLGTVISLHQRFSGCVRDVRAKPFALQSEEFRNLEYFLSYMSNGLEFNGPGARK